MSIASGLRPTWRFQIDPRVKKALIRLQNDNNTTLKSDSDDFGLPKKPVLVAQQRLATNAYVGVSTKSATETAEVQQKQVSWRPTASPPRSKNSNSKGLSEKELRQYVIGSLAFGTASYWTYKLWWIRTNPIA